MCRAPIQISSLVLVVGLPRFVDPRAQPREAVPFEDEQFVFEYGR